MDLPQPEYPLMLATLAAILSPLAVLSWLAVRLLRRPRRLDLTAEDRLGEQERLAELAGRIESVAADTQRLDEAQRFTTALLTERGRAKASDGKPAV